ncbi:MAG: phosphoribosyltransferase family protein [Gammaproteobacteria bacterium]|jgi:predicted phosphoribosyltransferase
MPFQNREQAARLLAQQLKAYQGKNPLVLAIPRGAAPMARIIANALQGEMDVVLVHKIGAPFQEELAIGSVAENGDVYLNDYAHGVSKTYIESETQKQLNVIRARRAQYTQNHIAPLIKDRIVIVVDDGIATGSTMIAALKSLRTQQPAKLIVAVGVAPIETIESLQTLADEVVCLETPENFYAVGQFFSEFPQVTDEEVINAFK